MRGLAVRPTNTVIILSDEHNRDIAGCYGDSIARTPNLDRLAGGGVRFSRAYTNSPVCVPARASFATGRYPHQIGAWDSATPYDGSVKGWGARLLDAGHEVVSIGKLHFRSTEDDNGFSRELVPMHVHGGVGWVSSLLRDPPAPVGAAKDLATDIGAGETVYTRYDREVTRLACEWIAEASGRTAEKPWVLYIGLVAPHFPLVAPQVHFHLYDDADIPPPRQYAESQRPRHPVLDALRAASDYDTAFDAEKVRTARQAYYGLCSFMDENVGRIVGAVTRTGQRETTRIIYSSDHGDNMGHRGLWGKSVMYEDSVAVPLIARGPDLPMGEVVDTPVSLVDLHPTITAFAGQPVHRDDRDLPGRALTDVIRDPDPARPVFSEYHDWCSITGMFMLRQGDWKLVQYPGYASQLFDLGHDPRETVDLGSSPDHRDVLAMMEAKLATIADVDEINARAFADQARRIERCGGRDAILEAEDLGYTPPPQVESPTGR